LHIARDVNHHRIQKLNGPRPRAQLPLINQKFPAGTADRPMQLIDPAPNLPTNYPTVY
jgi:hypothetical protein